MKLEIARGLFIAGALGMTSLCATIWNEPAAKVIARSTLGDYCPVPRLERSSISAMQPDQDLLLLMYGLSQSMVGRG